MVKQRMTALDVRATVEEMRATLVGLRLLNLYDLADGKSFLFKFGHGANKQTVLLENGMRLHLTSLVREKPKVPSQFTLKVRKHVREWRLDAVTQLQHDRTVDMCFGGNTYSDAEGKQRVCFHIIVELFGQGNVVLTDASYTILMLLRTHKDAGVTLAVRSQYPVTAPFQVEAAAATAAEAADAEDAEGQEEALRRALKADWDKTVAQSAAGDRLLSILSGVHHLGPALAEHLLLTSGQENVPRAAVLEQQGDALFEALLPALRAAVAISKAPLPRGAYLITYTDEHSSKKRKAGKQQAKAAAMAAAAAAEEEGATPSAEAAAAPAAAEAADTTAATASTAAAAPTAAATAAPVVVAYDDFTPILLAQHKAPGVVAAFVDSFGAACDAFFLKAETDKIAQHNDKKKGKAEGKREKFERDHARRISKLEQEQEENERKGEALMLAADRVDEALALINGALATGIQWESLKALLRRRHAEGHPVAYMIHELHLERNAMSVLLERDLYDDENDHDVDPMVVEVDLAKTAHANATTYFARRKQNRVKLAKTLDATDKAAAGAARKAERTAAKQGSKREIVVERAKFWWEKYLWFRTSAGDVVLRGKDASSTELLVRRVMLPGDFLVGCGEAGSLPCLVRCLATAADGRIARRSLEEAGAWCVAHGSAWSRKQSVGAWWVRACQLAGGTAAGEYETTGERHHLTPQPLALGCALLFFTEEPHADRAWLAAATAGHAPADGAGEGADEWVALEADTPLQSFPTMEEIWYEQKKRTQAARQHQQYRAAAAANTAAAAVAAAAAGAPAGAAGKKGKKGKKGKSAELPAAAAAGAAGQEAAPAAAATGGAPGRPLSKYQARKLKKIRAKYGEQDEEDRLLGALVNGNALAKVQLQELQRADAAEEEEGEAERERGDDSGSDEADNNNNNSNSAGEANTDAREESEHGGDDECRDDATTAAASEAPSGGDAITKAAQAAAERERFARIRADTRAAAEEQDRQLREAFPHYSAALPPPRASSSSSAEAPPACPVQHAVCVCAPFTAVFAYQARVELLHSVAAKRGQVANAVMKHFRAELTPKTAAHGEVAAAAAAAAASEGLRPAVYTDEAREQLNKVLASVPIGDVVEQVRADTKPKNLKLDK